MGIHETIIALIINRSKEEGIPTEIESLTPREAIRMLFQNYREDGDGQGKGLRLTFTGNQILSALLDHYILTLPEGFRLLPKHILYLDRFMVLPWHFYGGKLTLYDGRAGVQLRLLDGDIDRLIKMKKANKCWNI